MMSWRSLLILAVGLFLGLASAGCRDAGQQESPAAEATVPPLADQPLVAFRVELLEIAFEAVSKMPANPHIKDRCRNQAVVFGACLELDQPRRALRYSERIDNWRRGIAYADYAIYCARHGHTHGLDRWLKLASVISRQNEIEEHRRAQILARIATARVWMAADTQPAIEIELDDPAPWQQGELDLAKAMRCDPATFSRQLDRLDRIMAAERDFDARRNALTAYGKLFARFFADSQKRALIEARIRQGLETMPPAIRVIVLESLAQAAIAHGDQPAATALVGDVQKLIDGARWPIDHRLRLAGPLCKLRGQAGDRAGAIAALDALMRLYEDGREQILSIDRAETLHPLAEAYGSLGDRAKSLSTYALALREGNANPNARPRCEDLAGLCCSMARNDIEPDEELWAGIRQTAANMKDPW